MSYCALDEAFLGPAEGTLPVKRHKKLRPKETSVPTALPDVPGSVKMADDVLGSQDQPYGPNQPLQAGQKSADFFPVPGESWESAFMLDSDFTKTLQRPDSSVPVAGRPTLWRESVVASAPASQSVQVPSNVWADVNQRLDKLTKQLEKLTSPTQNQSTAELFLFVAIGLIVLLAIDTLLRFAASIRGSAMSLASVNPVHTGGWRHSRFGKVRFR